MNPAALLVGAGIGAAVMYYLDPERGNRRRALLRDQWIHAGHKLQDAAQATTSDLRNRARGYSASRRKSASVTDEQLVERVRAAIGRSVAHPAAIDVSVSNGIATLSGPVLASEVPLLIDRALDVAGVRDVTNRLEVHEEVGNVPALQGTSSTRGALMRSNWPPAARAVAGAIGAAASVYGLASRGLLNRTAGLAGLALLARAGTNLEFRRLAGVATRRHAISVHKTIRLNAPVERVFEIWEKCENYPHFMTHVREVRPRGGERETQRWHWKVRGNSGMEFEFDTATTAFEENRFIAWRTESGSLVQHRGSVRFRANPDGSTTVEVTLAYYPVAGGVGHVIAKLLGDDPKRQLDDDLMRMKSYVETGIQPRDAAAQQAQEPRTLM